MLDFRGNPSKCLAAEPPSDPDGLIAETRCFVAGQTPTATQPISSFIQNWSDCIGNLPTQSGRSD
jgi:hypothetical protein